MAIPSLHLPFDGTLEGQDREGPVTAIATGAVRWVDGPRKERKLVRPLLVASPDHTEDRHGPLTPHLSSSVTLGEGKYGKTWKLKKANTPTPTIKMSPSESRDQGRELVETYEDTVNLLPNPSFEAGGGWSSDRVTTESDTSDPVRGSICRKVTRTTTSSTSSYYSLAVDLPSGTSSLTFSVYAKAPVAQTTALFMILRDAQGQNLRTIRGENTAIGPKWRRVSVTAMNLPVEATKVVCGIYNTLDNIQIGDYMWVDAAQLEAKPYATPYVDGDMAEGEWTGTPHASTSTRSRGTAFRGALRSASVESRGAWHFEEDTTNYIRNPRGAVGDNHVWWNENRASVELVPFPDPSVAETGYKVTWDGSQPSNMFAAWGTHWFTTSEPLDKDYPVTISADVILPEGEQFQFGVRYNHAITKGEWITGTGSHQRIVYSTTLTAGSVIDVNPIGVSLWYTTNTNTLTGRTVTGHITNLQMEAKPYATSYCDGDAGPGYAWTGTPHASPSTRTKGTVQIPFEQQVTAESGAVYAWLTVPEIAAGCYPISMNGTNGLLFGMHSGGYVNSYLGSGVVNLGSNQHPVPRDTPVLIGLEWDASTAYLVYNGEIVNTASRPNTNVSFGSTIVVGYWGSSNPRPSYVHNVVMFPKPLTDAQRTYLYENPGWAWDDLSETDGEVSIGHEATENLILNPWFEDLDTWTTSRSDIQIDPETTFDGQPTILITSPFDSGSSYAMTVPIYGVTPGEIVSCAAWVKRETAGMEPYLNLFFYDSSNTAVWSTSSSWPSFPNNVWEHLKIENVTVPARAVSFRLLVRFGTGTRNVSDRVWFAKPQLEKKPYITDFCPVIDENRELVDGFEWTGDPHRSSSTRPYRGRVNYAKDAFIRYIEDGEQKVTRITDRAGAIGSNGMYTTFGGSLRLLPFEAKTLEVEEVVVFENDMELFADEIAGIDEQWSMNNTEFLMDVPVQTPYIEEGSENWFLYPTFEFMPSGSVWNVKRDEETLFRGRPTLQLTFSNDTGNVGMIFTAKSEPVYTGDVFTLSFWAKGKAGLSIYLYAIGGQGLLHSGQTFAVNEDWTYHTITFPALSQNASRVDIRMYRRTAGEIQIGDQFWIAEPQLERKAYATSFAPQFDEFGYLREGYYWTDTPFRSSCARMPSGIMGEMKQDALRGGVVVRYRLESEWPTSQYILMMGDIGATSTVLTNFTLWFNYQTKKVHVRTDNNLRTTFTTDPIYGEWQTVYIGWDEDTVYADFDDGVGLQTAPRHTAGSTEWRYGPYLFHGMRPGSADNNLYSGDFSIDGVMLFDRPLTEAECRTLFTAETWEWISLFPTLEKVSRRSSAAPLGIIRLNGDTDPIS